MAVEPVPHIHEVNRVNRIEFISKEQDWEYELADHGVRKYDYDIGRFTCTDVLFENYYGLSPFQYSANNRVSFVGGKQKTKILCN